MVGPKELMTRSFTWSWSVPWTGQDKSYVAMRRCLDWPERSDDEVLHVGWSVPWVGQEKSYVAMRKSLGWPKGSDDAILHMHCYESSRRAKMTRLARRNSLGGPRQFVWCLNMDERTSPVLCKFLDSLTEWLNKLFGKNYLFKIMVK
jgi:hypothetical protein